MEKVDISPFYDYSFPSSGYKEKVKIRFYNAFHRIADIIIALIGLVPGIPLMIVLSIAIVIETKGPALFIQERVGYKGKIFKMYKLRSMIIDSEKYGVKWTEKDDCRITKVGKFIRRARLDEIPQLFNVLKGDMSIIGPRPEVPQLTMQFAEKYPNFTARLCVKPGITGWAQVNGGYELTPEQKLNLDIHYIKHRNIRMYLLIIIKTFKVVLTGEGSR